jgi:lipopolysaccharide assembly protein A
MQFLKILFWCLLSFLVAIFTWGNWSWVSINLWGGLVAEVNLPFMLLLTFLAGAIPTWLYHRTLRWRLSQRLATAERVIADLKPIVPMGSDPGIEPAPAAALPSPPPPPAPKPPRQPPLELTP